MKSFKLFFGVIFIIFFAGIAFAASYIVKVTTLGGGIVTGGGIYAYGTKVTLTATPASGYKFSGWYRPYILEPISTNEIYPITVTGNLEFNAQFAPIAAETKYTVNLGISPNGSGIVTGAGTYTNGSSVTVAAEASADYLFSEWTENGVFVSSEPSYTFNIGKNRNLVAIFNQAISLPVDFKISEREVCGNDIAITWNKDINTTYYVYRSVAVPAGTTGWQTLKFNLVNTIIPEDIPAGVNVISFVDKTYRTDSRKDNHHFYYVKSENYSGVKSESNKLLLSPDSKACRQIPVAPTYINARTSDVLGGKIRLTWDTVSAATGYKIYRYASQADADINKYEVMREYSNTDVTEDDLTPGSTYYYRISAFNDYGESGLSSVVSAIASKAIIPAPTFVKAEYSNSCNGPVVVSWQPAKGVDTYAVYRINPVTKEKTVIAYEVSGTQYADRDLYLGQQFGYGVQSVKGDDVSSITETSAINYFKCFDGDGGDGGGSGDDDGDGKCEVGEGCYFEGDDDADGICEVGEVCYLSEDIGDDDSRSNDNFGNYSLFRVKDYGEDNDLDGETNWLYLYYELDPTDKTKFYPVRACVNFYCDPIGKTIYIPKEAPENTEPGLVAWRWIEIDSGLPKIVKVPYIPKDKIRLETLPAKHQYYDVSPPIRLMHKDRLDPYSLQIFESMDSDKATDILASLSSETIYRLARIKRVRFTGSYYGSYSNPDHEYRWNSGQLSIDKVVELPSTNDAPLVNSPERTNGATGTGFDIGASSGVALEKSGLITRLRMLNDNIVSEKDGKIKSDFSFHWSYTMKDNNYPYVIGPIENYDPPLEVGKRCYPVNMYDVDGTVIHQFKTCLAEGTDNYGGQWQNIFSMEIRIEEYFGYQGMYDSKGEISNDPYFLDISQSSGGVAGVLKNFSKKFDVKNMFASVGGLIDKLFGGDELAFNVGLEQKLFKNTKTPKGKTVEEIGSSEMNMRDYIQRMFNTAGQKSSKKGVYAGAVNSRPCQSVGSSGCTNVKGLSRDFIGKIADIKVRAGENAFVVITGGTEYWLHGNRSRILEKNSSSHGLPLTVDISKRSSDFNAYVRTGKKVPGCSKPVYILNSLRFYDEDGAHWHVEGYPYVRNLCVFNKFSSSSGISNICSGAQSGCKKVE